VLFLLKKKKKQSNMYRMKSSQKPTEFSVFQAPKNPKPGRAEARGRTYLVAGRAARSCGSRPWLRPAIRRSPSSPSRPPSRRTARWLPLVRRLVGRRGGLKTGGSRRDPGGEGSGKGGGTEREGGAGGAPSRWENLLAARRRLRVGCGGRE
jgi:hypothetical protein